MPIHKLCLQWLMSMLKKAFVVTPPRGQKVNTTSIYNRRRRVRWQVDKITISAMRDFSPITRRHHMVCL